jgi:tRNA modification GTPase
MLPPPRQARFSSFLNAHGRSVDEGLALYFPAPASYTGEHVLELQGHGGALVVDLVLQRLMELGCRLARPGEFSERAFLNGKIDIAQAEAIADLIDACTAAAASAAVRSMQGEFSARIADLQSGITGLRAFVEAAIDFPDDEIDFLSDTALRARLASVFAGFDSISAAARQGALLREGLTVVIAGKPNAGKSSLLNRLAGDEVAIVTDAPGTTRDVLRQQVHLDGLPLNLVDTAGLRAAVDAAEAEGVRRARNEIARADRVLYVLDCGPSRGYANDSGHGAPGMDGAGDGVPGEASVAVGTGDREHNDDDSVGGHDGDVDSGDSAPWAAELEQLPAGVPVTLIFNKIDLTGIQPHIDDSGVPPRVFLSARTGTGLDLLRTHLKASAGYLESESGALAARRRHIDALNRARQHVQSADDTLSSTRAFELFAEDLRLAQQALGEITGEFTSDDLLGEIFGSFCIGK